MLKKISMAILVSLTLAVSAVPATAAQSWYTSDGWGNHRLHIYNDGYTTLYCRIRGSNGVWSNASVPPGYTYWFNIYNTRSSWWRCDW
jgi:hypothetical protein